MTLLRRSRAGERRSALVTGLGATVGTALAYAAALGWDQRKQLGADGSLHGPYAVWQVVALVLALGGCCVWGGRRGRPVLTAVVVTVVLTVLFAVDAATDPPEVDDGLWPIGAAAVALGSAAATAVAAVLGDASRRARHPGA